MTEEILDKQEQIKLPKTSYILPAIVGIFSLLSVIYNLNLSNIPKFLVSIIGIVSVVLFFLRNDKASLLIKIWIIAQIPDIISETEFMLENGFIATQTINYWHTTQLPFSLFTLNTTLNSLDIGVNIAPFLLLGLYRLLNAQQSLGMTVDIEKGMQRENKLGDIFPLTGRFVGTCKLDNKEIWFVAGLDKAFVYNKTEYNRVLVYPKQGKKFENNKRQLGHLRLVSPAIDDQNLKKGQKKHFPFVDYVGVNATKPK